MTRNIFLTVKSLLLRININQLLPISGMVSEAASIQASVRFQVPEEPINSM